MVFLMLILTLMLCFFSMFNHLFPRPTVSVKFCSCVCFFYFCSIATLSLMHCKHYKLSRRALLALRANVVINIVYKKKKL